MVFVYNKLLSGNLSAEPVYDGGNIHTNKARLNEDDVDRPRPVWVSDQRSSFG